MDLQPRTYTVTRADLVAYADASGDHNPIHQDEAVALAVGLPGVIAHGMYTLALVARYLGDCDVDTEEIAELGAKFVKPVVVPVDGVEVTMAGTLETKDGVRSVLVAVVADDVKVFGPRGAVARLHG